MWLWVDGAHGPRENMRRDAALLERLERSTSAADALGAPVLRLFRFAPAGITLGRAQTPAATLDLATLNARGLEWAVRPTGGRAIYHEGEWTYAFAARIDDPRWGGSLRETYARVSALVCGALNDLGVPAVLATTSTSRVEGPAAARRPSCFAATLAHEIELAGRKLVGSAQRRGARAWLQQGSVLLDDSHVGLADVLALDAPGRVAAATALAANSATAGPYLGEDRRLERWAAAIAARLDARVRRRDGDAGAAELLATPAYAEVR